jgi:hypothetical protein
VLLILFSFLYPLKSIAFDNPKQNKKQITESVAPLSKEEVLQTYIGVITSKYTKKPLSEHYGMNLPYQLEDVKVIDAKMIYSTNNVDFIFKTQVQPFVGAHNPVGTDEFTFRISDSVIKLLKYEHIESFSIPPHLNQYYKNLKPNY